MGRFCLAGDESWSCLWSSPQLATEFLVRLLICSYVVADAKVLLKLGLEQIWVWHLVLLAGFAAGLELEISGVSSPVRTDQHTQLPLSVLAAKEAKITQSICLVPHKHYKELAASSSSSSVSLNYAENEDTS
ncbi:hypothetical protein AAHA92_17036 [Salvia divinorum]|uniref:Uncharacterized protein n=1 Tax=Salvia divinorum TaxID=28513 RepID=A0ABD1GXI1_SALDI